MLPDTPVPDTRSITQLKDSCMIGKQRDHEGYSFNPCFFGRKIDHITTYFLCIYMYSLTKRAPLPVHLKPPKDTKGINIRVILLLCSVLDAVPQQRSVNLDGPFHQARSTTCRGYQAWKTCGLTGHKALHDQALQVRT